MHANNSLYYISKELHYQSLVVSWSSVDTFVFKSPHPNPFIYRVMHVLRELWMFSLSIWWSDAKIFLSASNTS